MLFSSMHQSLVAIVHTIVVNCNSTYKRSLFSCECSSISRNVGLSATSFIALLCLWYCIYVVTLIVALIIRSFCSYILHFIAVIAALQVTIPVCLICLQTTERIIIRIFSMVCGQIKCASLSVCNRFYGSVMLLQVYNCCCCC